MNSERSSVTNTPTRHRHCARIATAAEWLFDARSESSPTGLVQTAIAFEALYGGAKGESVVETLANRIAYTLGRTPQHREWLVESFTDFYDTRSKVVHNGASRLTNEQKVQLGSTQRVLKELLRHELRLVAEGATSSPQVPT